jgi:oxygen-independent coproporphyrinogen-3 oxidase
MAGIYIHIPFCRKACHYCNFHFSTSLHRKPELLNALQHEILSDKLPVTIEISEPIETLYFGGGTPSLLTIKELDGIMRALEQKFHFSANAEITLEANPDDIHPENLDHWKTLGINRLSIGIQSFRQEELTWMNRAHNEQQAFKCLELAASKGFDNLNIDLIYGTPTLSDDAWKRNLEIAGQSGVNHLSCYALTVEENTALHHFVQKGKVPAPAEERQITQFEILMDWAAENKWDHYEISNLCKPGHHSRHNSNYWSGKPYIGFGPSAHSFDGSNTRWNGIANNALYIKNWLEGAGELYQSEIMTPSQLFNERIMTGLRRKEGLSKGFIQSIVKGFTPTLKEKQAIQHIVDGFLASGLLIEGGGRITLSGKGKLFADHIAAELFL